MKLVFERFAASQRILFVIGADGTGQKQITDTPWGEQWPSFSPDGTKLLFVPTRTATGTSTPFGSMARA